MITCDDVPDRGVGNEPPAASNCKGRALPLCYITMAPVQGFEPRPVVINSHVPCQLGDTGSKERDVR